MYDGNSNVIKLTGKDFQKRTQKGIWLVQFYAPWCGHCKNLEPQYQKAAKILKGIAKIAAIDADAQKPNVAIQGYPTIKFYIDGKSTDYNGQRTAKGIVQFIMSQYRKLISNRMGQKPNSGNKGSSNSQNADQKDVVVLTDQNFDQLVMQDNKPWFIQFYAPWCGHCQRLAPQWSALASTMKGNVKVAKVDATQSKGLAARFGIQGYPTIKFFPSGKKDENNIIDYSGPRDQSGMSSWLNQQTAGSNFFQHIQLTSQQIFDQNCKDKQICVISFLPHKLDSTPEQRSKYLQIIKNIALKFKSKPFKFIWTQGGDHLQVQQKLSVAGVGYPSVSAVFNAKGLAGKLRRSFSQQNLQQFVNQILSNKAKFSKISDLTQFKKVQSTAQFAQNQQL